MLDMGDGSRDGVAGQLDTLRQQCDAISPTEILAELKKKEEVCVRERHSEGAQKRAPLQFPHQGEADEREEACSRSQ